MGDTRDMKATQEAMKEAKIDLARSDFSANLLIPLDRRTTSTSELSNTHHIGRRNDASKSLDYNASFNNGVNVDINEEKNSVTVQILFYTIWQDLTLNPSNTTEL